MGKLVLSGRVQLLWLLPPWLNYTASWHCVYKSHSFLQCHSEITFFRGFLVLLTSTAGIDLLKGQGEKKIYIFKVLAHSFLETRLLLNSQKTEHNHIQGAVYYSMEFGELVTF